MRYTFVLIAAAILVGGAGVSPAAAGGPQDSSPGAPASDFLSMLALAEPAGRLSRPLLIDADRSSPSPEAEVHTPGPEGINDTFSRQIDQRWALFSSQMTVRDRNSEADSALTPNKWQTEDTLRVNLFGPFSVFGQFGTRCDSMNSQEIKLTGKTGLVWKLQPLPRCEVQVRGGPTVIYDDPLRPERTKEQSDLFLEVQCRCPLPGRAQLEYDTSAVPALNLAERDRVSQDLRLALPLGKKGSFRLGAKHNWENTPAPKPWTDGMQLYVGVDLKR